MKTHVAGTTLAGLLYGKILKKQIFFVISLCFGFVETKIISNNSLLIEIYI